jgi:alkylation response protein AidB-like acyl-CoA dehydrogenase
MAGWESLGQLFFDNCRVPAFNLIGRRGIGRGYTVRKGFAEARIGVGSFSLGVAEVAFEEALNYAKQRIAFGQPISKFQFVQAMLVDVALELELSRLLRDKAATSVDEGNVDLKLSSMVKYFCCESAKRATDHAIQIFGGLGFTDECRVSRLYRGIRMATIADGTTEIQKFIIAREMGC